MNRRSMMLAALALAGCASVPPRLVSPTEVALPELEPLFRADAGRDGLTISVASSGCTVKADFAFYLERSGGALGLAFARKRLDSCQSFAMGRTDLTFGWAELGVGDRASVFLLNPFVAWAGPGR